MKPSIGITFADEEEKSDREYLEAVAKSGGRPVILRPSEPTSIDSLHGLILSGGGDVDPKFYGETKESFCHEPNLTRDQFEFSIIKSFLKKNKPVFAICRGIQILNVALGGSLYQDLEAQLESNVVEAHRYKNEWSRDVKRKLSHGVNLVQGSKLHKLFGSRVTSNSRHHQAIKAAAPSLDVTARAEDGVIEGVESKEHSWVIGVEWHPESVEVFDLFAPLFEEFIRKSAA